ncbi:hypothetical protein Ciccas_010674 [Cichlidogyrus casuarinus]|uniref:Uncharacterized protein n=1 Tax=Cichlidogyrus casuarinus TaxID=1844966 RepID=A0ABD2PTG2_9PLAT
MLSCQEYGKDTRLANLKEFHQIMNVFDGTWSGNAAFQLFAIKGFIPIKTIQDRMSETVVVEMDFKLPTPSSAFLHQNGPNSVQLHINGQNPNCAALFQAQLLIDSTVVQTILSSDRNIIFKDLKRGNSYIARVSIVPIRSTPSSPETVLSQSIKLIDNPET